MASSKLVVCLLALSVSAGIAHADIVTPISVTASSEFAAAVNMINGSGMSGVGEVELQTHDNDENNMWQTFSSSSIGETAEFVLDASHDLTDIVVWQYNGLDALGEPTPQREIDQFSLAVSTDLVSPFVPLGTFKLAPAVDPLSPLGEPAQIIGLPISLGTLRVLLTIDSIHGDDDGFAGLSEVRFRTEPPLPVESKTWGAIKHHFR